MWRPRESRQLQESQPSPSCTDLNDYIWSLHSTAPHGIIRETATNERSKRSADSVYIRIRYGSDPTTLHLKPDGIRPYLSFLWFCYRAGRSDNGDDILGAVHQATVADSAAYETPVVRQALRFDEWKDPSEEALAGGRGMFCILPIAKSMLNVASLSISLAADFVIKALKSPIQLSRQELHANLCSQFHKLALNMQGWNLKLITLGNRRQNAMNSEEVPTN
ncbi:unnamed protein product [Musa acuminata subsp. malaccensis]|uniref:(wild Malaysian banana) hypothetical protein n=1 Tax=Musa acuminata subsp. malaccensis TaxID=214687 RepID=A0A804JI56_MUSAM|nr:PREDICTED: uncharacterized protein LOC103988472 [Musa acuminata subsp. malaccensis]CAG1846780.1 unnamed protein product [Musa acuminata subsp. malaccensis]